MPPRYVVDHGQIFRMTEAQYQRYLLACSTEVRNAEDFGRFVGTALTVTNLSPSDFRDLCDAAAEVQTRAIASQLSVACPTCDAMIGELCSRLGKRWESVAFRGNGAWNALDKPYRKVPHPGRMRAASLVK